MSTLFERIAQAQLPAFRLYEDELVFAILDIHPLSPGHSLLIPKEPAEKLHLLSERSAEAIGRVLPMITRILCELTACQDYQVLQNNGVRAHQDVPHVHFHIIPKPSFDQGLSLSWKSQALDEQEARVFTQQFSEKVLQSKK